MKTRNIMYVAVGLLFVVAIAGVVYGFWSHLEPGLAEGAPTWQRDAFPLNVVATRYAVPMSDGQRESVNHTIDVINSRLDFDALEWADGEPADIVIIIGVPQDVSEGAPEVGFAFDEALYNAGEYSVIRHRGGVAEQCEFRTSNTPAGILWLVLYHGFGHCFGLAHDDYALSIMYPEQRVTPARQLPPWFSDDDRSLLREMYAPH